MKCSKKVNRNHIFSKNFLSAPTRSRTVLDRLKAYCNPPVSRHLPIYDEGVLCAPIGT